MLLQWHRLLLADHGFIAGHPTRADQLGPALKFGELVPGCALVLAAGGHHLDHTITVAVLRKIHARLYDNPGTPVLSLRQSSCPRFALLLPAGDELPGPC